MTAFIITAAVAILCIIAAAEIVNVLSGSQQPYDEEFTSFTVMLYRPDDYCFERRLRTVLSQMRWTDPCFCGEIYIVHCNVPDEQSAPVRELCSARKNLRYISTDDFEKLLRGDKNSFERDCILSKKGV